MAEWKLWYADGTTFSSDDGEWWQAPTRGVQLLVTDEPNVGREVQWGTDYYVWWPNAPQPWSVDKAGLWDFLHVIGHELAGHRLDNEHFAVLEEEGVKFGRSMPTADFRELLEEALADPDFPPKSARTLLEDHPEN